MSTFTGMTASVWLSGTSTAFLDEATTDVGGLHTTYQLTNTAKQILDRSITLLVETQIAGAGPWVADNATTYTVTHIIGTVVFTTPKGATDLVRFTCNYFPVVEFAQGKEWGLSIDANMVTTTVFKSTWKQQAPLVKEGTVTFSQFYVDNYFLTNIGNLCILDLWINEASRIGYRCYGWIKDDSLKVMEEDVNQETISFDIDTRLVYINV